MMYTPYLILSAILRKVYKAKDFKAMKDIIVSSYSYHFTEQLYIDYPEAKGCLSKGHDYDLKSKNMDVYAIYKKLIYLKTHVDGLALTKDGVASNLNVAASKGQITYTIKDNLNNKEYKIVHNDGASTHEAMDFAGYELYLDTIDVNSTRKLTNNEKANRFQTLIGVKSL